MFRRALKGFEMLFVQDEASKELLAGIGVNAVSVAGDTRFDRVEQVRRSAASIPAVAGFAKGHTTLVAGSTWPPDEQLLAALAQNHPALRLVIAPHEIGEERVEKLAAAFPQGKTARYTRLGGGEVPAGTQVLIIDTIGMLSSVYAYAGAAYIGGGFGAGIHNTLEAAVYGIPIAFGPNYEKFREARELIAAGAAASVADAGELDRWFSTLVDNPTALAAAGQKAAGYVASHTGATDMIMKTLFGQGARR
jgi:3-deoxy-D-manno-octulosonic-acid transferase